MKRHRVIAVERRRVVRQRAVVLIIPSHTLDPAGILVIPSRLARKLRLSAEDGLAEIHRVVRRVIVRILRLVFSVAENVVHSAESKRSIRKIILRVAGVGAVRQLAVLDRVNLLRVDRRHRSETVIRVTDLHVVVQRLISGAVHKLDHKVAVERVRSRVVKLNNVVVLVIRLEIQRGAADLVLDRDHTVHGSVDDEAARVVRVFFVRGVILLRPCVLLSLVDKGLAGEIIIVSRVLICRNDAAIPLLGNIFQIVGGIIFRLDLRLAKTAVLVADLDKVVQNIRRPSVVPVDSFLRGLPVFRRRGHRHIFRAVRRCLRGIEQCAAELGAVSAREQQAQCQKDRAHASRVQFYSLHITSTLADDYPLLTFLQLPAAVIHFRCRPAESKTAAQHTDFNALKRQCQHKKPRNQAFRGK